MLGKRLIHREATLCRICDVTGLRKIVCALSDVGFEIGKHRKRLI
jgi:hypothetical protein